MKRLVLIAAVFLFTGVGFAQQGDSVKGNTVTVKEIAPVWPGCADSKSKDKCFNQKVNEFIKKNFKYQKNSAGQYIRGKATISFTVDKNGKVTDVTAEGPEKAINNEIKSVVESFPKMQPGTRAGKPVAITHKMVLNF